jgi:hypothetical protein
MSKKVRNKGRTKIESIVEPLEGILVFDQKLRPLFCNKMIKPLCLQICKSGTCVLEKGEKETPELFNVIRWFRIDCERLSQPETPGNVSELVPDSIVYLSPVGDFTIRCIRLGAKAPQIGRKMWQISLLRAITLTSLDIEIIDRKYGLTAAELKVLKHTISGLSSAETATRLMISNATIKCTCVTSSKN